MFKIYVPAIISVTPVTFWRLEPHRNRFGLSPLLESFCFQGEATPRHRIVLYAGYRTRPSGLCELGDPAAADYLWPATNWRENATVLSSMREPCSADGSIRCPRTTRSTTLSVHSRAPQRLPPARGRGRSPHPSGR